MYNVYTANLPNSTVYNVHSVHPEKQLIFFEDKVLISSTIDTLV